MENYSDPITTLSKGYARWYSNMCVVVAFEKENLSDKNIGNFFEADVTANVNGKVTMSINNECEPSEMSRMFDLINEVTESMRLINALGSISAHKEPVHYG